MTDLERLLLDHGSPPDHEPDFEARLWTAVAATGEPHADDAGVDAPEALAPAHQRRRQRTRYVALLAAAGAAAALIVGVAVSRHAVREYRHPAIASAAEVAANVRTALSSIRTLRAEYTEYYKVVKGPPESTWQRDWTTADWWARARIYSDAELKAGSIGGGYEGSSPFSPTEQIVATADGRWRKDVPPGDGPSVVDQYTGDDAAGVSKYYSPPYGPLTVARGVSLGLPDYVVSEGAFPLYLHFSRAQTPAAMSHVDVRETTCDGRPSLTVSWAIAPVPIEGLNMDAHLFDTVELTVDRETWLIVRTSLLLRGQVVQETRITNIRVNEPVSDAQLEPTCPDGTKTKEENLHFRRVSFGEAAHAFSTRPLEPRVLPDEFHRFAAAVAARAKFTYWVQAVTDAKQAHYWPPSREVTQLGYRAGLLQFVVTTRAQPSGGPLPADLFEADPLVMTTVADDPAASGKLETVKLSGGAWHGVTAYVVIPLLYTPHLWAWHDGKLITVAGDLTRSELLSVANSLQPME